MRKPKLNDVREQRSIDEIVVDANGSEERAMSWYYYLEEKLRFPFKAKCLAARAMSPLEKDEAVEVFKMAPEDDCMKELFIIVGFAVRTLGAPLSQLEVLDGTRIRERLSPIGITGPGCVTSSERSAV